MLPPSKTELAMEKMLQAAAELQSYVQSGDHNPEQQKQLADAVKVAWDEFSDQLAKFLPSDDKTN